MDAGASIPPPARTDAAAGTHAARPRGSCARHPSSIRRHPSASSAPGRSCRPAAVRRSGGRCCRDGFVPERRAFAARRQVAARAFARIAEPHRHQGHAAGIVEHRSGLRPVQARRRSPLGSSNGTPLACTREPGACPMIRMRDVALNCTTGRGPAARSRRAARAGGDLVAQALHGIGGEAGGRPGGAGGGWGRHSHSAKFRGMRILLVDAPALSPAARMKGSDA